MSNALNITNTLRANAAMAQRLLNLILMTLGA